YTDAQVTLDWYAQRFVAMNGRLRYRWLDRFITGGVAYQELRESGGSTSRRVSIAHSQDFSLTSRLTANLDYASSSRVISRNAVDPVLAVATIDSRLNFSRRFAGGTLAIGGSRTQSLDKPQVTMSFPVVAFAPQPINLGTDITWSPSFNMTNATMRNGPAQPLLLYSHPGAGDTLLSNNRQTTLSISTPLRIGRWNWGNSLTIADSWANQRARVSFKDPDDTTRTVTRTYAERFATSVDWVTSVNLPVLFQGTWNLQPRVDIANTGGGPFMVRNLFTGGRFVSQGKRLAYGVGVSPTFFGLFAGVGPIARVRHSISPSLSWQYSPAATLPEDYARAVSPDGRTVNRTIEARQALSLGLSQNFEAKLRPPPGTAQDSTAGGQPVEGRKIKLLSVQSGGISFDLEQAKRPGRTGWVTDQWSNTFTSDLLRGFSVSTSHDLWDGRVGYRGSKLRPFLTSVSMRFAVSASTMRALGSLIGLVAARPSTPTDSTATPEDSVRGGVPGLNAYQRGPLATPALDRMGLGGRGPGFTANLSFDAQRVPDTLSRASIPSLERRTLSGSVSFSPTRFWSVSWQTQYNFTTGRFGEHVVRLDRALHDWRATFSFVQSPNGNFLFNFFIQLIDQPDIKFEYDQRNIR
ncbi:MAG: putative LPS assembly protein LptD, partial [Gemmatimonadota bacterium]